MKSLPCARCGAKEIIENVDIIDRGEDNRQHDVELQIPMNRKGIFFNSKYRMKVLPKAQICTNCGHVNVVVSADDIADLAAANEIRNIFGVRPFDRRKIKNIPNSLPFS